MARASRAIIVVVAELVVVTGPPGAGKSTVARALSAQFERSALVVGDDFFGFLDQGYLAPWTAEAHEQNDVVVGAAAAAAGRLVAGGYTVIYDGVIGPWFVPPFITSTGLTSIHYVVLLPPEATCVERVRTRVGHGFSNVDATRHMYRQFAEADVLARHVLVSTEPTQDLTARIRVLVDSGAIVWPAAPQPHVT